MPAKRRKSKNNNKRTENTGRASGGSASQTRQKSRTASGTEARTDTGRVRTSRAAVSEQMRNSSNAGVRTRARDAAAREAREQAAKAAAKDDRVRTGSASAQPGRTRTESASAQPGRTRTESASAQPGRTRTEGSSAQPGRARTGRAAAAAENTRTAETAKRAERTKADHGKKRSGKAKRKRNRRIRRLVCLIAAALLIVGCFLFSRLVVFDSYKTVSSLELSNSGDLSEYMSFGNGYVKITENGITYFNGKGIIWSETYSMTQPVYDVCRGYIAVADIKQNEVYIFDKEGLVGVVSTEYSIIDIEVSKAGVIAAATDDDDANYIEVYDKSGNELLTARSVFSTSGYLTDISLSSDGTKLAAAFINVDLQDIVSRVVFYDFSQGSEDSDVVVGGFNQYTDTVLTNVEFLDGDRVAAIGDNALTIYDFSGTPEIIYEDLELEWTIDSIFLSGKYIGFITDDSTGTYNYAYCVYNRSGEVVAEGGFDLSYTKAQFYGKYIMVNSSNACYIYDFSAKIRFSCAFEENIEAVYPAGIAGLIYATASATNFIRLK